MTTSKQSRKQHPRFLPYTFTPRRQVASLLLVCTLALSGCAHLRFDTRTDPALGIGRNNQIREVSARTLDELQQKCGQTAQQSPDPERAAINHSCTTLSDLHTNLGGNWHLKSTPQASQLKNPELQVSDSKTLLSALTQSATADRDLALVSTAPNLITALKVQQWKLSLEANQLAQTTAQKPLPLGKVGTGKPVLYQNLLMGGKQKTFFMPNELSLDSPYKLERASTTTEDSDSGYQEYLNVYDDQDEFFTGDYQPIAQNPEEELQILQQSWWTMQTLTAQISSTTPAQPNLPPDILNAQVQQLEKQIKAMEKAGIKAESKLSYPLPVTKEKSTSQSEQLTVVLSWIAKLYLDKAIAIEPDEKNTRLDAFNNFDQVISTSVQLGVADGVLNSLVTTPAKKS